METPKLHLPNRSIARDGQSLGASSRPEEAALAAQRQSSRREALTAGLACVAALAAAGLTGPPSAAAAAAQHVPLWDIADERADLISPTVLPELSDSERLVRHALLYPFFGRSLRVTDRCRDLLR